MHARIRPITAGLALCLAACAGPPQLPREFDLREASWWLDSAEPALDIAGDRGRSGGAVRGAAIGGGTGVTTAALACGATGPLLPLCLVTVVPASLAIGALGGAAVGAVLSDSAEVIEAKRHLLQTLAANADLGPQLAARLVGRTGPTSALGAAAPWQVRLSVRALQTVGEGPRHALGLAVGIEVWREGETAARFAREVLAQGRVERSTEEWLSGDTALQEMQTLLAKAARDAAISLRSR